MATTTALIPKGVWVNLQNNNIFGLIFRQIASDRK
jgi:hypothetical protein